MVLVGDMVTGHGWKPRGERMSEKSQKATFVGRPLRDMLY